MPMEQTTLTTTDQEWATMDSSNSNLIQSVPHPVALNSSTQIHQRITQKTTSSQTLDKTMMLKPLLKTRELHQRSLVSNGFSQLVPKNTKTKPKRLTITSTQSFLRMSELPET